MSKIQSALKIHDELNGENLIPATYRKSRFLAFCSKMVFGASFRRFQMSRTSKFFICDLQRIAFTWLLTFLRRIVVSVNPHLHEMIEYVPGRVCFKSHDEYVFPQKWPISKNKISEIELNYYGVRGLSKLCLKSENISNY